MIFFFSYIPNHPIVILVKSNIIWLIIKKPQQAGNDNAWEQIQIGFTNWLQWSWISSWYYDALYFIYATGSTFRVWTQQET